jgi:hypothetical protein
VHPKLAVTAIVPVKDFAALLEERVKRIAQGKIGGDGMKVIGHEADAAPIKKTNVKRLDLDGVHTHRHASCDLEKPENTETVIGRRAPLRFTPCCIRMFFTSFLRALFHS